jgi:hypothetical protein
MTSRMMMSNNEHEEDAKSRGTAALGPTTRGSIPDDDHSG